MKYEIKHKDGTLVATTQSLTYSSRRMGEEFVVVTLRSYAPIDFEIGDYITYRGVNYYMNVIPSVKKKSSRNSVGDAFTYDSIKFESASVELVNCSFRDVVLGDNQLHTALPNFAFTATTAYDLANRIQANLDSLNNGWTVICTNAVIVGVEGKKNINVSVDNINCWEALALVNSEFDLNFSIRGRVITIGKVENQFNAEAMKYGLGNGLVTIEKTTDENQQIITRLRAYGNTTNMPTRYYANIGVKCRLPINRSTIIEVEPRWKEDVFTRAELAYMSSLGYSKDVAVKIADAIGETKGCCFIAEGKIAQSCFNAYDSETKTAVFYDKNKDEYIALIAENSVFIIKKNVSASYFAGKTSLEDLSGVSVDNWPAGIKSAQTIALSPNLHVDHLMLPSFPANNDPYIQDDDLVAKYGVREATVFFDGSNGLDDIYPSIANVSVAIINASGFDDNGIFGTDTTTETVPPFKITISFDPNEKAFNPWEYKIATETAYISMKSGMCAGRQFEITSCKQIDARTYELTCKREEKKAFSRYFPYSSYPISASDTFVFLGIAMPKEYIDAAAKTLETAAMEYLAENSHVKYNYSLTLSSIFMQRMVDAGINWHETICAGQSLVFEDADLIGEDAISIPIESLEIKEGEESLPKYTITLSDSTQVSTLSRVQNEIKSVQNTALTTLYPLSIKNNGKLVGTYNPALKGITIELATPESVVGGDSYFEEYETGKKHLETRQKRDEEGNLLWLDSDKNETTEDTGVPSNEEIEVDSIAVRLKPQYVGLFSEGFMSAYGLNANGGTSGGSGEGGGGTAFNRLDRWEDYTPEKAGWVLSAALGYELANRDVTITKAKVISALGYTPFNSADFTKENIKSTLGISDWALKVALDFSDLPKIYWADQQVSQSSNALTEPSFGKVKLTNGTNVVTLSIDENGNLHIDKGVYSDSFVSAFGKDDSAYTGVELASGTWGDDTYTNSHALPAKLGKDKIDALMARIAALESGAPGDTGTGKVTKTSMLAALQNNPLTDDELQEHFKVNPKKKFWANLELGVEASSDTTPTFGGVKLKNGDHIVTLSVDGSGALMSDAGFYSASFVSAFGKNASDYAGVELASGTWGDETYTNSHALPAKLGKDKIDGLAARIAALEMTGTGDSDTGGKVPRYWANLELGEEANSDTTPTFGSVKIGSVTLSCDASGYLHIDSGMYSDSFVSAFGKNASDGGTFEVTKRMITDALGYTPQTAIEDLAAIRTNAEKGPLAISQIASLTNRVVTLENGGGGGTKVMVVDALPSPTEAGTVYIIKKRAS